MSLPAKAIDVAPTRVLFFGDSLVAGVGDPAGGGWVARVLGACAAGGTPMTAYNLGVRRETSTQVVARWRAEAAPRIARGVDARLVVSFGANDETVEDGTVRVPADSSARALAAMLDEGRALDLAPFVVGPAPVEDIDQNWRIEALTAAFADVCHARSTPFIGVFEPLLSSPVWMSEIAAGDGAHPGLDGYGLLAQLLIDAGLLTWLTDTGRAVPSRQVQRT
jgi:acyl-CoA thioesterase I